MAKEIDLDGELGEGDGPVREVWSPYRLSPIGAHTDHQLGLTTGFTLDHGIRLRFRRNEGARVRLVSRDFAGEVAFTIDAVPDPLRSGWGDYARGIARELQARHGIRHGIEGVLAGDLAPGGISTSAALQTAVLLAFLDANDIPLDRMNAIQTVVAAERNYAGVNVGILDPAVILFGQLHSLVVLDCREGVPHVQRISRNMPAMEWILVDSGLPRDLRKSPYNLRVEECRAAARAMGAVGEPPTLREVAPETFRRMRTQLDPVLRRRAEHVFSENKRVKLALELITSGDVEGLGQLITASGESLTTNFECGTSETRDMLDFLRGTEGVLGASYAGGGFGGMLQALARPGTSPAVEAMVKGRYAERHPELAARAKVQVVSMGPRAEVRGGSAEAAA